MQDVSELPQLVGGYRITRRARSEPYLLLEGVDAKDRPIVVHILPLGGKPEGRGARIESLLASAAKLVLLSHPSIIPVVAFGEMDGSIYLVVDRVEAPTMLQAAQREPFDVEAALSIGAQLADALLHLHRSDGLARDLHPGSTLVCDGRAVMTAPLTALIAEVLTGSELIGSPGYIAPELLDGRRRPWPGSDQFSLGRILMELCQAQPFAVPEVGQGRDLMTGLSEIDRALRAPFDRLGPVLRRMITAEPDDRFPSLADVSRELITLESEGAPWEIATDQSVLRVDTAWSEPTQFAPYSSVSILVAPSGDSGPRYLVSEATVDPGLDLERSTDMASIKRRTDEIRSALAEHAGAGRVATDPDLRDDEFDDATIPQASVVDSVSLLADARIQPGGRRSRRGDLRSREQHPLDGTFDQDPAVRGIETDRGPVPLEVPPVSDPAETSIQRPTPALESSSAVFAGDSHDDVWDDDDETRAPSQPSPVRPLMPAATDHTPVTAPSSRWLSTFVMLAFAALGFAVGLSIVVLILEGLEPLVIDSIPIAETPADEGSSPLFIHRGTSISETDRGIGARIYREARSCLRDGQLDEAERMLGMCIEVADLADCHRDLGILLSITDHPSAGAHLARTKDAPAR